MYALYSMVWNDCTDELYLALVRSSKAHARLLEVDPCEAFKLPGVVDFISHKDIPAHNSYTATETENEIVFVTELVCSQKNSILTLPRKKCNTTIVEPC